VKIRVIVNNIIYNKVYGAIFENENGESDQDVQDRLNAWKNRMEEKAKSGLGWGWCAREIPKTEMEDKYLPILIEEYERPDVGMGGTETWCVLDKEYTYEEVDLTAEQIAQQQEAAEDEVTLQQIKQAVNIINGWTQLSDININFLKKFFKYLIKKSI